MAARLISIIGPPGVGKTTLAEALSAELPGELIREDYAGNPFLADSYAGQASAALPAQLYFLMSRVGQLSQATWPAQGLFVSDYGYCQDAIYASRRLDADDLRLYRRIARRVDGLVHPPDVLIRLDAGEQTLLERIASRGRAFEKAMTHEFLADMRRAYRGAIEQVGCPVLMIDCNATDLRDETRRRELIERLGPALA